MMLRHIAYNIIFMLQRQNEELLAEQEILQQTTSEQLFQIETLRARLEQQKQNAPFAQRQATSRLESQLYEMNDKLEINERILAEKDMEVCISIKNIKKLFKYT
jgi:preprotein translocase subunit SecD